MYESSNSSRRGDNGRRFAVPRPGHAAAQVKVMRRMNGTIGWTLTALGLTYLLTVAFLGEIGS
jgi:hypothetical protein